MQHEYTNNTFLPRLLPTLPSRGKAFATAPASGTHPAPGKCFTRPGSSSGAALPPRRGKAFAAAPVSGIPPAPGKCFTRPGRSSAAALRAKHPAGYSLHHSTRLVPDALPLRRDLIWGAQSPYQNSCIRARNSWTADPTSRYSPPSPSAISLPQNPFCGFWGRAGRGSY